MDKRAITPLHYEKDYQDWRMSLGLECGDFMFLTGLTGEQPNGTFSAIAETQIRDTFRNVESVLKHGGLSWAHAVEMTTYHVGLHEHISLFRSVRNEFVVEPYPAWTAVEVVSLVDREALVEIRVIAHR